MKIKRNQWPYLASMAVAILLVIVSFYSISPYSNKKIVEESQAFSIKVDYPKFSNKKIDADIKKLIDKNISIIKAYPAPLASIPTHYKNTLNITYEKPIISDRFISTVFYVLYFTGGAHPSTTVYTNNYDKKSGIRIKLTDVCTIDGKTIAKIKDTITTDLISNLNSDGHADLSWIKNGVNKNRLETFSVSNNRIIFYFQQYEVGPYSNGIQRVSIAYPID